MGGRESGFNFFSPSYTTEWPVRSLPSYRQQRIWIPLHHHQFRFHSPCWFWIPNKKIVLRRRESPISRARKSISHFVRVSVRRINGLTVGRPVITPHSAFRLPARRRACGVVHRLLLNSSCVFLFPSASWSTTDNHEQFIRTTLNSTSAR